MFTDKQKEIMREMFLEVLKEKRERYCAHILNLPIEKYATRVMDSILPGLEDGNAPFSPAGAKLEELAVLSMYLWAQQISEDNLEKIKNNLEEILERNKPKGKKNDQTI